MTCRHELHVAKLARMSENLHSFIIAAINWDKIAENILINKIITTFRMTIYLHTSNSFPNKFNYFLPSSL